MNICHECGMSLLTNGEYHPFAACLMFRGCNDGDVVRSNLQPDNDWQPIETAPRDGTRVLLATSEYTQIGRWLRDYKCRADAGYGGWMDDYDNGGPEDDTWPTHWMPLPEPPK